MKKPPRPAREESQRLVRHASRRAAEGSPVLRRATNAFAHSPAGGVRPNPKPTGALETVADIPDSIWKAIRKAFEVTVRRPVRAIRGKIVNSGREPKGLNLEKGRDEALDLFVTLAAKSYPDRDAEEKPKAEGDEKEAAPNYGEFGRYDKTAVNRAFGLDSELSDDAKAYLKSDAGRALLKGLGGLPEGHALRMFAERWLASAQFMTRAEWEDKGWLEVWQKHMGEKPGKAAHDLLKNQLTDDKLKGYAKDGFKPALDAFVKYGKKEIEEKKQENSPDYAGEDADKDIKDLEKINEIASGIEDDLLGHVAARKFFVKVRRVGMNPHTLEGLLLLLANPAPVQSGLPGTEKADTFAGNVIGDKLSSPAELPVSVPFKAGALGGELSLKTNPLVPDDVLSGKTPPNLGVLKSAGSKFEYKEKAGDKDLNVKTGFKWASGELAADASYESKDKNGSAVFKGDYVKNKDGTQTKLGVDLKSGIFRERLGLNLSTNASGAPAGQTASVGLGIESPLGKGEKPKTLSSDADAVFDLAGEGNVNALSAFVGYKDPKALLNTAAGYQLRQTGQVRKDDLALALKKTWKDLSFYIGASFGMDAGAAARANVTAGTEAKLWKSNYGIFAQGEYDKSGLPGSHETFKAAGGLLTGKGRVGAYFSNNPADRRGISVSLTFDPSAFVRLSRK